MFIFWEMEETITIGIATTNIAAQVTALIPVTSLNTPAIIPPIIPPTSNNVDKSALSDASNEAVS